ncbi:polycystin-1-like protein 3 [Watersipora subatra]|uniref:polycystin-1-like protein 3 n=1 Tax=Watersipora subatra TaxID=2589382 RepID=UPI00355C73F7
MPLPIDYNFNKFTANGSKSQSGVHAVVNELSTAIELAGPAGREPCKKSCTYPGSSVTLMLVKMKEVLFIAAACCLITSTVEGHGYLIQPPARGSAWRVGFKTPTDTDDMANFCGGRGKQHDSVNQGRCGVCGEEYSKQNKRLEPGPGNVFATGTIVGNYNQGETIDVSIMITAFHKGYFEFRLCENNIPQKGKDGSIAVTYECLNKNLLESMTGGTTLIFRFPASMGKSTHRVKLPAGVSCSACVMQWRYKAGNNWGCEDGKCGLGLGPQEEFIGCSDIAIQPNGNNQPKVDVKQTGPKQPETTFEVVETTLTFAKTSRKPVSTTPKRLPSTPKYVPPTQKPIPSTQKPVQPTYKKPAIVPDWMMPSRGAPVTAPVAVETDTPVRETDAPVLQTDPPVVQPDPPVVQPDPPVLETDPPVQKTDPPAPVTKPPVPTTKQADVVPPVTSARMKGVLYLAALCCFLAAAIVAYVVVTEEADQTTKGEPTVTKIVAPETSKPAPTTEAKVPETDAPVIETDAPVLQTDPPVVQTDPPVLQTDPPVVQTDPPVLETDPPVVQTDPPVLETDPPVQKTDPPAPVTKPPVPTTKEADVVPPATISDLKPDSGARKTCRGSSAYGSMMDSYCDINCNHVPPYCPASHCICGAVQTSKKTCRGLSPFGATMDSYCDTNCNHVPSYCPASYCKCE